MGVLLSLWVLQLEMDGVVAVEAVSAERYFGKVEVVVNLPYSELFLGSMSFICILECARF